MSGSWKGGHRRVLDQVIGVGFGVALGSVSIKYGGIEVLCCVVAFSIILLSALGSYLKSCSNKPSREGHYWYKHGRKWLPATVSYHCDKLQFWVTHDGGRTGYVENTVDDDWGEEIVCYEANLSSQEYPV